MPDQNDSSVWHCKMWIVQYSGKATEPGSVSLQQIAPMQLLQLSFASFPWHRAHDFFKTSEWQKPCLSFDSKAPNACSTASFMRWLLRLTLNFGLDHGRVLVGSSCWIIPSTKTISHYQSWAVLIDSKKVPQRLGHDISHALLPEAVFPTWSSVPYFSTQTSSIWHETSCESAYCCRIGLNIHNKWRTNGESTTSPKERWRSDRTRLTCGFRCSANERDPCLA